MIDKLEARELIDEIFEEEALVIGGLVAVHEMNDDFVWRLVRNLEAIRKKVLRRLEGDTLVDGDGSPPRSVKLRPHPAIEEFLISVRRA